MMPNMSRTRPLVAWLFVALIHLLHYSNAQSNSALWLPGNVDGTQNSVALPPFRPSFVQFSESNYQYSFEAWIYPETPTTSNANGVNNSFNDYGSVMYTRNTTTSYATGIFIRTSQSVPWELRSSWANQAEVSRQSTGLSVSFNAWHHVAFTINSTSHTIYLDDQAYTYPATTGTRRVPDYFDVTSFLGWDMALPQRVWRGLIDEVRVWNVARTREQLAGARYQSLQGNEPGLVAYYNFDDNNANDRTVNGYHGSMGPRAELRPSTVFSPVRVDTSTPITSQSASTASPIFQYVKAGSKQNPLARVSFNVINGVPQQLILTEIRVNLTGTTTPGAIERISVYSTNTFDYAGDVFVGSVALNNADFSNIVVALNVTLLPRVQYFWLTADISPSASIGTKLFAACSFITIGGTQYPVSSINATITYTDVQPTLSVAAPAWFSQLNSSKHEVSSNFAPPNIEAANFVAFQQDAILTFNRFQYVTFWNMRGNVVVSRRYLRNVASAEFGAWEEIEFWDYTISNSRYADNHYSISMGICHNDGSVHVAYDMHGDDLNYRKSIQGVAFQPAGSSQWSNSSFTQNLDWLVAGTKLELVTYPRFFTRPDGNLQFEYRYGTSGAGDNYMHWYNATSQTWTSIGKYASGLILNPTQNAYMSRVEYDPRGRLHVAWIWRQTPDPLTNHDIYYGYSDDQGSTWKNSAGDIISRVNESPMTLNTSGLMILPIGQRRGLINQESQTVDSVGRLHMLVSHLLPDRPTSTNFWNDRTPSIIPGSGAMLHHVYQLANGTWTSQPIGSATRNRAQITVDAMDNLYVVAPNQRVFFAANSTGYATWTVVDYSQSASGINEPQIDRSLLLEHNILSLVYSTLSQSIKVSTYNVRVNSTSPSSSSTGTVSPPTSSSSSSSASVTDPIDSSSGINQASHVVGSMLSLGMVTLATSLLFV